MFYGYSAGKKYTYEIYPELFADNLTRALRELKEFARGQVSLGVENVGGFRYPWVFPILHKVLGGKLCLTMDVGHINVYKGRVKEVEEDFFKAHRRLIRSSHLHDNDGKWDMHDIIGNGSINFIPYLRLLAEQNAWCIFEVRPRESAVECLTRFRERIAPRSDPDSSLRVGVLAHRDPAIEERVFGQYQALALDVTMDGRAGLKFERALDHQIAFNLPGNHTVLAVHVAVDICPFTHVQAVHHAQVAFNLPVHTHAAPNRNIAFHLGLGSDDRVQPTLDLHAQHHSAFRLPLSATHFALCILHFAL